MVEVKLRYKRKTYTIKDGYFDTASDARYMYEDGNYSCDDNRSLFINVQCDKDFPLLACGETIQLISIKTVKPDANAD